VSHVDVERSRLAISRRRGALSSVVRVVGRDPVSQHSAAPCEEIWGRRRKRVGWRNYDRDRQAVALCVILSCVE
jgi:hypothetical protein